MSWNIHHTESERLASQAETSILNGDNNLARELYSKAAEEEMNALNALDQTKHRTIGITAVSTVSLLYKGRQFSLAEKAAYRCLGLNDLPEFASDQLHSLLQSIWNETAMEKAGIKFVPGQILVAIKGGEIVKGGAPLDLIVEKVQTVQSYFYRTAEFLKDIPHRKRGRPEKEIQDIYRPWLFHAVPSSYQFAMAIQEPVQFDLFDQVKPSPKDISGKFLSILRSCVNDPDGQFLQIVTDRNYQETFLKLSRNLIPKGKSYTEMEIRASDETRAISLIPSNREIINNTIKKRRSTNLQPEENEESEMHGILRAVHLDKDWIEVTINGEHKKISDVGDIVDDVIGPMLNRPVIVKTILKENRYKFIDIELDE
ncbi:MAG: hypothetical protein Q8O92_06270 [Candidatus Latescibacter sp.]|nr:hypothetical protein [Candidatus Latescibacter sp.]